MTITASEARAIAAITKYCCRVSVRLRILEIAAIGRKPYSDA